MRRTKGDIVKMNAVRAGIQIEEVTTGRQLGEFVRFPDKLYAGCPQYVPAIYADQIRTLTKSASLEYCTQKLWLARAALASSSFAAGEVIGRICAIINPRYNERYGKKCCRFGWFDCIDDLQVAKSLTDAAQHWAAGQGMTQIHGPLFYNTLGKQGMLVDGFENLPQFTTIYNYRYYPRLLESLGFVKECDWVQYRMRGCELPERLDRLSRTLMERYRLHFADVETLKKDHALATRFMRDYSDIFSRSVYNFIPFTDAEIEEELRMSIPMLKNECCAIIMDEDDNVAAFGLCFPSLSRAMQKARGSLFPFGWYHVLKALDCHRRKENDTLDMMLMGAAAKWEGKGLSAVLNQILTDKFAKTTFRYFICNPQIETNRAVDMWENYPDREIYMRRRCYIKDID